MAKLKQIRMDGQTIPVDSTERLVDLLPGDVESVRTDHGQLVKRADFARVPIPDGFETNLSAINKGGAPQVATKRKPVIIDGTYEVLPADASINAIVPADVKTVRTYDGQLIQRADFARVPIPDGFETNLSAINKGCSPEPSRNAVSR